MGYNYSKSRVVIFIKRVETNYYFYHVGGFVEMKVPSNNKIHPSVGIGFTYLNYDNSYVNPSNQGPSLLDFRKDGSVGYNLKFGVQYDLTSQFFLQSHFHFVRTINKLPWENEVVGINYIQAKFGLGYRF